METILYSHSNRFILRTIDETYVDSVLVFVMNNKHHLSGWEMERDNSYFAREHQLRLIHADIEKMKRGELFRFWMFSMEANEAIIGTISLSNIVRGAFQSCHLGYRIDANHQGKGLMSEAIQLVVKYAFEDLKLHRVEANIMPRNRASFRVVEKNGFRNEGISRKYLKINGKWEDHIHMVLLNEDMEEGREDSI